MKFYKNYGMGCKLRESPRHDVSSTLPGNSNTTPRCLFCILSTTTKLSQLVIFILGDQKSSTNATISKTHNNFKLAVRYPSVTIMVEFVHHGS
mmetsp:Transcript_2181/g.4693  ORF Transcript_2181/g.4693 Transcript_2181/m.4693 type:complete len:93 (+) Transcript_2181:226-504(+)